MYGPATSGNHKIPDFMVTGFGGLGDEEDGHGDVGDVGDGDVVDYDDDVHGADITVCMSSSPSNWSTAA